MLVELGLPSCNSVLHNAAASFNRRLGCSTNRLVKYVFKCSFYSVVTNSLELFFSSLVIFSYYPVCPVCFYGLLPDSNK